MVDSSCFLGHHRHPQHGCLVEQRLTTSFQVFVAMKWFELVVADIRKSRMIRCGAFLDIVDVCGVIYVSRE